MYFNQDLVLKPGTTATLVDVIDVRFSQGTAAYPLLTSSTETLVNSYESMYDVDVGNNFQNGLFTAPFDGVYLFHFSIRGLVDLGIASFGSILKKNGSTHIAHVNVRNNGKDDYSGSGSMYLEYIKNASVIYSATANDTFGLYAYFENVEETGYISTYSIFRGTLLRKT